MNNEQKIIATKLGLLKLAERLGNVSEACKVMGYSRDSFYRFKELYDQHHEYQLYLAIENIDHTKTKARHPQTNGICERFHRTMQDEFYAAAFCKKVYTTLEELHRDVNEWLEQYNRERTHTGKYCFGRTPLQTFRETKYLAQAKMLDTLFEQPDRVSGSPDESVVKDKISSDTSDLTDNF
jgi:hypothetical protein